MPQSTADTTALRVALDFAIDPKADSSFSSLSDNDAARQVREEIIRAMVSVVARSTPATRIEQARKALDAAMNPHDDGDNDPLRPLDLRAILKLRDRAWAGVYPWIAADLPHDLKGSAELPREYPKWYAGAA